MWSPPYLQLKSENSKVQLVLARPLYLSNLGDDTGIYEVRLTSWLKNYESSSTSIEFIVHILPPCGKLNLIWPDIITTSIIFNADVF